MKRIQDYVDKIDDEICGAKEYAEKYIEYKVMDDITWANRFKEMANDELKHATYIHDLAMSEIKEIGKVFKAPQEMQEAWDKSHVEYVDRVAWIKQMLQM